MRDVLQHHSVQILLWWISVVVALVLVIVEVVALLGGLAVAIVLAIFAVRGDVG